MGAKKVTLPTGKEVPKDIVFSVAKTLKTMWNSGFSGSWLLYRFRDACLNNGETFSEEDYNRLVKSGLIVKSGPEGEQGLIRESTAHIVLACIQGEGRDVKFVWPLDAPSAQLSAADEAIKPVSSGPSRSPKMGRSTKKATDKPKI